MQCGLKASLDLRTVLLLALASMLPQFGSSRGQLLHVQLIL